MLRAVARERVWARVGAPRRVVLDIDATLITSHSEKEGAAGTYKDGYGFNPLLCFEASTGDPMSGVLRPGNAGANHAWDHIEVLCLALEQVPERVDRRGVLVRCDSAGATHRLTDTIVDLEMCFSVGFDLTERVREAILRLPESAWRSALSADGEIRAGAEVAEFADLDLSAWPAGTRAICRRERPHPGAQLPHTDHDGHRFQRSSSPTRPAAGSSGSSNSTTSERVSRTASAAPRTRASETCPFATFQPNAAWLELVLIGQDLIACTQRLLLAGTPAHRWEPKRLRYRLPHVAGRLTRHARRTRMHLPAAWPWRHELVTAWQRLGALQPPAGCRWLRAGHGMCRGRCGS